MRITGEVDKIVGDEANIVFKIGNEFIDQIISLDILREIEADFEGARIYLVKSKKDPIWAKRNSKMEKLFQRLRK